MKSSVAASELDQSAGVPRDIFSTLYRQRPRFHGQLDAGIHDWSVSELFGEWLRTHIEPGSSTLETGCGYTSIIFATLARQHVVISPFAGEHVLIKDWCAAHGLDTGHVEFIAEPSQTALPKRPSSPLDVVLIDGDHSFPAPFIDWYYVAEDVKPGGLLIVDDTQLVTGKILRDFLICEEGRWRLEQEIGHTAIFRRVTSSAVVKDFWWGQQPYVRHLGRDNRLLHKIPRPLRRAALTVLPSRVIALTRRALQRLRGRAERSDGQR